jgi:hypothetical protein
MPCSPAKVKGRLGGGYRLHLQSRRVWQQTARLRHQGENSATLCREKGPPKRPTDCRGDWMGYSSAVQRFYILGHMWLMAVEARAPCGDCNKNNNNKVILIVILIQITTDFIFMTVFPKIFWSSHEIIFICKQETAREDELSEGRFMTPRQ